jgi:hypothetical protein
VDINGFVREKDQRLLIENELACQALLVPEIGSDDLPTFQKVVIVSDGYQFNEKKSVLYNLPKDVCVIGTNRTLARWDVDEDGIIKRRMDYYFVNNPFSECISFIPRHKYRPRCICSIRTNAAFLKKYKGQLFHYIPTPDKSLGQIMGAGQTLDDYRNPICGALSLAIKCGAQRILFFCCDDVFKESRPAAEQLPNGMWMYPQHKTTHELLDGMLYWLKGRDGDESITKIANHSAGPDYENANYISLEAIQEFLNE